MSETSLFGEHEHDRAHPLSIAFEHEDFIVVNKPVGLAMHDAEQGIVACLQQQHKHKQWFLAHRLDTPTSGCILLAKHKQAAAYFGNLFEQRLIEKFYIALSNKKPKKKQGLIKGDMHKVRKGSYKLVESADNPAITQIFSHSIEAGIRAFLCKPHSGKTHQIRVALKAIGAPIIGDKRYGSPSTSEVKAEDDRLYLHSMALRFRYQEQPFTILSMPTQGKLFQTIQTQVPDTWLEPWRLPWPRV